MVDCDKPSVYGILWFMPVEIICQCGKIFFVTPAIFKRGAKFCSMKCAGEFRKHKEPSEKIAEFKCPCGNIFLKYKSSIKKESTEFYCSRECKNKYNKDGHFKVGHTGYRKRYEGDDISYGALHDWVHSVKTKTGICEQCKSMPVGRTEWANKSHQYKRDIDDWMELCVRCHRIYDKRSPDFGASLKRFGRRQRLKPKKRDIPGYIHPGSVKVVQISVEGKEIKVWDSMKEIKKELGISHTDIIRCCKNSSATSYGFRWQYKKR